MENITKHKMSTGPVFYYNDELYVSANLLLPKEVLDSLPVQKFTPIDFEHNGKKVYKLKEYKHRIRIQECTKDIVKEFLYVICDFHLKSIDYDVFLIGIHEANINYTHDGVLWIDANSMMKPRDKHHAKKSLLLTCYLFDKYLHESFNSEHDKYTIGDARKITNIINKDPFDKNTWIELRKEVENFNHKTKGSNWYYEYSKIMDINNPKNVNEKAVKVANILESLDFDNEIKTVTDIGCNKGYYSLYIANKNENCNVVGFDFDEKCVNDAIMLARKNNLNAIFSLKDIPSFCNNKIYEFDRFSSDLVIALAITHHMKKLMSVEDFANGIASIADKYILIEDIVNVDKYQKEFEKRGFVLKHRCDSYPAKRQLSLYQKV